MTLSTWQAQGTYTIASATSSKFTIAAASADFGGALFSDAAFHLDHGLEHQASLMNALANSQWSSPAWQLVTFYYWSYFGAMAFSRMLGKSVWFVTPPVAQQFSRLAATGSVRITQGTYEIHCGTPLSAGMRQIHLTKRPRRLHEQLWATLFDLLRSLYSEVGANVAAPDEERLFLAILNSARTLGDDWPSAIRNVVNYRPGFAYTAPRFRNCLDTFSYLSTREQSIDGLVDRLENDNIAMQSAPDVQAQPRIAARMLVDLTILINRMANALHDEIVDRNDMDRRWLVSKQRFAQQQGIVSSRGQWPC